MIVIISLYQHYSASDWLLPHMRLMWETTEPDLAFMTCTSHCGEICQPLCTYNFLVLWDHWFYFVHIWKKSSTHALVVWHLSFPLMHSFSPGCYFPHANYGTLGLSLLLGLIFSSIGAQTSDLSTCTCFPVFTHWANLAPLKSKLHSWCLNLVYHQNITKVNQQ